jgi:anti-sigma28 factor (negative regulator of flagellin synthesis)
MRFPMVALPDNPGSSVGASAEEPTPSEKILALLDHIRTLDKAMDEARIKKIANIKKALSDGTYHVSAAEVARKLIDQLREP